MIGDWNKINTSRPMKNARVLVAWWEAGRNWRMAVAHYVNGEWWNDYHQRIDTPMFWQYAHK